MSKDKNSDLEEILSGKKSGVVDMRTGKVLVTDKQLFKDLKKWLASFTKEEWCKKLEEKIRLDKLNKEKRKDE